MKVLLRQNVGNLGQIGEVVSVRSGYARNYLLPQGLAMAPTEANLKSIEAEKLVYAEHLAKAHADLEARAALLQGKEVTITALANEEGHLYGSIGPAQIVAALDSEGLPVEAENIMLDEPITRLDKYEVTVQFSEGITARIGVWVVPPSDSEHPQADSSEDAPPAPETDPVSEAGAEDENT